MREERANLDDTLSYLANVYNHKARDFYAKHGVKIVTGSDELWVHGRNAREFVSLQRYGLSPAQAIRAGTLTAAEALAKFRAPELWAAVVAERLGFDEDEALTMGRVVAGLNAYSKGKALGIPTSSSWSGRFVAETFTSVPRSTDRDPASSTPICATWRRSRSSA